MIGTLLHMDTPTHLHLDRINGLDVTWPDGSTSQYPIGHLRRWSPCAAARQLRETLSTNPLAVMPSGGSTIESLEATAIERVGAYAIRISFTDGHRTGLYSWAWLRSIDPAAMATERT
jgi:DUF971 family protein